MFVHNLAFAVLSAALALAQPATANDEFSQVAEAADRFANSGKPVYIGAERALRVAERRRSRQRSRY